MFWKKKDKEKSVSADEMRDLGAVGFTMDDVRQVKDQKESPNAKAYEYMVQAMAVSANYMGDTITEEGIRMDDVYPTSLEETLKMDELLDKSERAVQDENDEEYNKMIVELRSIVGWSRRRHYNFSWIIILGTLITVGVVMHMFSGAQNEKSSAKRALEKVEAWSTDSSSVTLAQALDSTTYGNAPKAYIEPIYYQAYIIRNSEHWKAFFEDEVVSSRHNLDTCTSKDLKDFYKDRLEENEKSVKKYTKRLEEARSWNLKEAKKDAVAQKKLEYRAVSIFVFFVYIIAFIFISLIPLYIFANHSWGYVITKYREESEKLEKIKRWGFSIAAGMFGAAAAMEYLPDTHVTTYYSDGSTSSHTETNAGNYIIFAIKVGLLILALAIIAVVSTGILIYSTIVGLKRNYDWKAIYKEAKETAVDVSNKAVEVTNKAVDAANKMKEEKEKEKK